jgi:hypothetical protein
MRRATTSRESDGDPAVNARGGGVVAVTISDFGGLTAVCHPAGGSSPIVAIEKVS